jgi:succinate-semialdehyde dehydrogenase/glutarate-semialdehyde dehydrogenase
VPYGVVAVIGPWNFPLATPGTICVHALAAGNAVILKPSHITPGVGEWLVRCWRRAVPDLPDVLQNLIGYAVTGQALIGAGVDKVAFTGSVRSGKAVAAQCAGTLTPMLLELGGKDAAIVAEDADLDEAAAQLGLQPPPRRGHRPPPARGDDQRQRRPHGLPDRRPALRRPR